MIITRKEVVELAEMGVDMRVYVDIKTFGHSFTPALLIAKLGLDVDFNRVYKKSLNKLIKPNSIVSIKALENHNVDKCTINTPLDGICSIAYARINLYSIYIVKIDDEEIEFVIQDTIPINEEYIERSYTKNEIPII